MDNPTKQIYTGLHFDVAVAAADMETALAKLKSAHACILSVQQDDPAANFAVVTRTTVSTGIEIAISTIETMIATARAAEAACELRYPDLHFPPTGISPLIQ
jgi:hypothetical protein